MVRTGILLHVYHLQTKGWEQLVWGDPASDQLGTLPKLVEILLTESTDEPVSAIIMHTGPSKRGGLSEGEQTKWYLLEHFDALINFPRLKQLLASLSLKDIQALHARLEDIIIGEGAQNTRDEVRNAAEYFGQQGIQKVIQIAAASHAPRCIQIQLMAREQGLIPPRQMWSVVASETYFHASKPHDLLIFEPPHRGDDPMTQISLTAPQVLRRYFELDATKKQHFLLSVHHMLKGYEDS
jgi:hypothetical protein